ncbi:hypothetical protein BV25DRAFT_1791757 [Artomyces pyxidatus]|uniref:Uncharacterized protein n=1 Tax=Artomyces pyxidatus TaxID=48021 RepID=A0ACB8TJG0_9AGAM|nr:hypothetical protein BV25DRAFT_1791757 [Artomyces pyxidatus]
MADSFADLWNSTAPVKPAQPAQKLGSSAASPNAQRRPQYDAFSLLASSASASPSPRSLTPSSALASSSQKPSAKLGGAAGGDAFGSLLSGSFGSNNSNLTIAERAAKAEAERQAKYAEKQQAAQQHTTAWAGLDSLVKGPSLPPRMAQASSSPPLDDDWLFGSMKPAKPASPVRKAPVAEEDDWGLHEFISRPAESKPVQFTQTSQPKSLWELDQFDSSSQPLPPPSSRPATRSPIPSRSDTPGDFDFGDREDALLDDDSQDGDDILGDLARPVDDIPKRPSPPVSFQPHCRLPISTWLGKQSRAPSPPPHVIGQIVEMGFTPQQARIALASTDTGLDVEAALENLLSNGAGSTPAPERPIGREQQRKPRRQRYDDSEDEEAWEAERSRTEQNRRRPEARSRPSRDSPPSAAQGEQNYQQQADKLLAQASEIGLSVFSRANAFWQEGKTKVQKAYEERAAASRSGSASSRPANGRPKWMQEALDRDEERAREAQLEQGHASGGDEVLPPKPTKPQRPKVESAPPPEPQVRTGDLFSDDAPKAYVSPFRRGASSRTAPVASSSSSAPAPPRRAPSPIRLAQRQTVPASASAISASAKHKASGTEMFKLGRFAEAESAYTQAISQLPSSHLLLIPLLNNRALTRLKTGDTTGAVEDCTTVIKMIGPSYHPAREAKVTKEEEGASVDLGDALVKAWRRRAEAFEGKEKWDLARQDWEAISSADFAGRQRGDAASGAGRCRKMLSANNASDAPSASVPRPPPAKPVKRPAPRRGARPPSAAVNRLKQANKEAEAEEQARYDLKDSVDERLSAWKKGKETNIRALVASLDTVLWPELGLQKVGMAELVTPNQVKIRYTKAIAKLHPDKLNVNNTTLEQRMIANGVFGALNDAWNAFKP